MLKRFWATAIAITLMMTVNAIPLSSTTFASVQAFDPGELEIGYATPNDRDAALKSLLTARNVIRIRGQAPKSIEARAVSDKALIVRITYPAAVANATRNDPTKELAILQDVARQLKDADRSIRYAHPRWKVAETGVPPSVAPYRQYVSVLYATNRVTDVDTKNDRRSLIALTDITYRRSKELKFGSALVRVPDTHKAGEVERPSDFSMFGLTVYKTTADEKKYFTLKEIRALDRDAFVRLIAEDNPGKSAMVFVHGYNSSFDDAIFKTAQIAFDTHFKGVPIALAWPSKHAVAAYDYDRESASFSWDALLDLLHMIRDDAKISKVYIIAHSMGNQILLDALARAQDPGKEFGVSEIIMASPDVDRDVFVKRIDQLKLLTGGLTLYASSADKAMVASHYKSGGLRAGDISKLGPVTAPGLDTIDITSLGHDPFALNHGTFSNNRSVLADIGQLLLTGTRPPGVRSPQLIPMPNNSTPSYWKYPK